MGQGRPALPSGSSWLDFGNVAGLRALGTVNDLELDCLAFLERPESIALNRRVVHENVTPSVAFDEPIPFGVVEPLDLACDAHRSLPACYDATGASLTKKKRPRHAAFSLRRQARPASGR